MTRSTRVLLVLTTVAALAPAAPETSPASAKPARTTPAGTKPTGTTPAERRLLQSHELWATIDVCDPADQPNTVGIRGSMPGDGQSNQKLYMSFRLQYLNTSKRWVDLPSAASPGFAAIGGAMSARQGGWSFELLAEQAAATLRGVVDFEWRHGRTVILSATRTTTVGHKSLAGADPAGFSAATCLIA